MDEHNGQQRPRPQKEEIGQGAKEGRVAKLDDGAGNGGHEGRFRVRDAELVEVVDVGEAEDDGGEEDDSVEAGAGHEQQRDGGSPEETFFSNGALNKQLSMYKTIKKGQWGGWNWNESSSVARDMTRHDMI